MCRIALGRRSASLRAVATAASTGPMPVQRVSTPSANSSSRSVAATTSTRQTVALRLESGAVRERDARALLVAEAVDPRHRDRGARRLREQRAQQVARRGNPLAADRDDHVALSEPGLARRRARHDTADEAAAGAVAEAAGVRGGHPEERRFPDMHARGRGPRLDLLDEPDGLVDS